MSAVQRATMRTIWRRWGRTALFAVVAITLLRSTTADWNYVFSRSMNPSIHAGDCILVNKLAYGLRLPLGRPVRQWSEPNRGDIVLLYAPDDGERLVKRVVGVPGDRIEFLGGQLLVNGESVVAELVESFQFESPSAGGDYRYGCEKLGERVHPVVYCVDHPSIPPRGAVVVPDGQYYVLGDNRDESTDSRSFGLIARDQIIGRVVAVTIALNPANHFAPAWARSFRRVL